MKKSKKIIIAVVAAAVICAGIFAGIYFGGSGKTVSERIIKYYNKQEAETYEAMTLEDFTDFEWDYVYIYKFPTTEEEISKKIGIDYTTENDLSLTSGMIFVNTTYEFSDGTVKEDVTDEELAEDSGITSKDEIVYEEVFETDFESPYKFAIYPQEELNGKRKIVRFTKANAVFAGKRTVYDGENRYIFYPQSNK